MLRAENISVLYGARPVLTDVSLELQSGQMTALLGANGAGKTTVVKALNGTVRPNNGDVFLNGRSLTELSRREIARSVAVVAQENETRFPVTVMQFVLSGRFVHGRALGWETDSDMAAARSALMDCDLSEYGDRLLNHMSGGERQRVVLARALAAQAKFLLLDEPTANLDLAHQAMMFRLVRSRCGVGKAAALVITHDLNLAAAFADRVVLLKEGRIVAEGPPAKALTAESVKEVFGVDVLLDRAGDNGRLRVTSVF